MQPGAALMSFLGTCDPDYPTRFGQVLHDAQFETPATLEVADLADLPAGIGRPIAKVLIARAKALSTGERLLLS